MSSVAANYEAGPSRDRALAQSDQRKKEKEVNNNRTKKFHGGVAARMILGSLAAFALLAVSGVHAQEKANDDDREQISFSLIPPVTPTAITPPEGSHLFLVGHAFGSQGYVCLPKDGSVSWTVNGARPEATLFATFFGEPIQIITHFLSHNDDPKAPQPVAFGNATWQSSFDSSKVWASATPATTIAAGTDASCPNTGSIACLLLTAIGTEDGPTGGKILSKTTFIQRLKTKGGSAPANPATGCLTSSDVGHQVLVPYTADYLFYRAGE
jgi:hypothetical protein